MVKVCFISTVHNALDNRIFYREACSLQSAGYDIHIIAIHGAEEVRQGIKIVPLKRTRRSLRPTLWWKALRLAVKMKAQIYHIHDPELLLISPIIRLMTGGAVIYDIHESVADFFEIKDDLPFIIRNFFAWLFRWLEPFLAYFQNGLIFADDQIALSFGWIKHPKVTLFNFPSQSFLEIASTATKNRDNYPPTVIYLGGLKRNRGTQLMLDAFKRISNVVPTAQLLLVGPFVPASLETELRSEIERYDLTNSVKITGPVPFDQVGSFLAQASVGWIPFQPVPKYQKNIPTKLFEYMAYGIPVVSSDLYATRIFIEDGINGLLVKADDPEAHANAIIKLLSDTTLSTSIGKNGQASVMEHYRWSEEEKKLLSLYEQVLAH